MLGFPHRWTAVDAVSRTKRLFMLGNAVQVQCAQQVGHWLDDAERRLRHDRQEVTIEIRPTTRTNPMSHYETTNKEKR
jgi:hypothetical protein